MKTKPFTVLLTAVFALLLNCNNDDDTPPITYESTATITHLDLTLCACCGGWVINIEGEDPEKRFTNLPEGSDIDLATANLPISVNLNWSASNEYCGNGILIEDIALIN